MDPAVSVQVVMVVWLCTSTLAHLHSPPHIAILQGPGVDLNADNIVLPINWTLSVHRVTHTFTVQTKALTLIQEGTDAILTTWPGLSSGLQALDGALVPVFWLNDDVQSKLDIDSDVLSVPYIWPLGEVIYNITSNFAWTDATVIYDSGHKKEFYLVQGALQRRMIRTDEHVMSVTSSSEEIQNILRNALMQTASSITFFVFVCSQQIVLNFANEAKLLDVPEEDRYFSTALYLSRWLVVTSTDDVTPIEQAMLLMENMAVIQIRETLTSTLQDRVQESVDALESVWNHQYIPASVNISSDQCYATDNHHLMRQLLDLNRKLHVSCDHFILLTTRWQGEHKLVQRSSLCNNVSEADSDVTVYATDVYGMDGRTLTLATNIWPPFVGRYSVNNTSVYEGLCIEMLRALATSLNFTYVLVEPSDGQWGVESDDGNWTGLVGMLQMKQVDMMIAPLTITDLRLEVMDFSDPFYFEKTAMLLKLPDENEMKWRTIIEPFRWPVWLAMFASVIFTGAAACIITRLAVRVRNDPITDMFVHFESSLWYVFGAILTQGGSYEPQTIAGRTVIGFWWAYCIVIIASYGGNLIAFLAVSKVESPINTFEELVSQSEFTWGFMKGTVFHSELKNSVESTLKKIWSENQIFAASDDRAFSEVYSDHMTKMHEGKYAFINDRTSLLYEQLDDCTLALAEEDELRIPYGMGFPTGSPLGPLINQMLRSLRAGGMVDHWQQKYWPQSSCSSDATAQATPMSILDTQSAFYLLSGGIVVSLLFLFWELLRGKENKVSVISVKALSPSETASNKLNWSPS